MLDKPQFKCRKGISMKISNETNFLWATTLILYEPQAFLPGTCPTNTRKELVILHQCEVVLHVDIYKSSNSVKEMSFSNFSCMCLNLNIFSNLGSNCSNLLDLRNLQEQVRKAFCYQKLF